MPLKDLGPLLRGAGERFRADLAEPGRVQAEVLQAILRQNQDSAYGRLHGFAAINSGAAYAAAVPVAPYEAFAAAIAQQAEGASGVLTTQDVLAFEETGGSSDGGKLIPYTAAGLAAFQYGLLAWLDDLCTHHPGLGEGPFYWAISPACRAARMTPGGVPVGMPDAAYLGAEVGMAVAQMLAVPADVGTIADVGAWRACTLRHLFASKSLSMISVWSPSFLTELLRYAVDAREALAQQIAHDDPARAAEVLAELGRAAPDYRRLWPRLQVISCWDQTSAAVGAATLRTIFPQVLVQGKGLLATEGLVTIPLAGCAYPALSLRSGYFEFIDAAGACFGADALAQGQEYQLLMTTHSGLYRYALGDKVVVRGYAARTPLLEFIGRSSTASDLCGEKLSDAFVAGRIAALKQAFAMLAPESRDGRQRYVLLLDGAAGDAAQADAAAAALERALHDNPQYAYARKLGQLDAVTPLLCAHPLQDWLAERMARGQRLGDIKQPALLGSTEWRTWVTLAPQEPAA
ncbi:MAG: GH3 auxin-responsive promoter family protein [Pseudomonadota bacterium]